MDVSSSPAASRLAGKVVLVSGAAGGIGRATAVRLASAGARLAVADVDATRLADVAAACNGRAVAMDVTDPASVRAAVQATLDAFGHLDVLVALAGIFDRTPIPDLTVDRWDRVQAVNLRGTLLCMQAVIPAMEAQGGGAIVAVASMAGQVGGIVAGAAYAASKAGVIALSKSMAKYGARLGIRVNVVNPGVIATDMLSLYPPGAVEGLIASTPLRRTGTADEVAAVIAFLASDDARYMTGAQVDVNGGTYM